MIQQNYFLYLPKFLDASTKSFFPCTLVFNGLVLE